MYFRSEFEREAQFELEYSDRETSVLEKDMDRSQSWIAIQGAYLFLTKCVKQANITRKNALIVWLKFTN
jgi:hypothetical protein